MQLDTISIEFSNASFNQVQSPTGTQTLQSLENATNQWLNDPYAINTFVVLYHPADFEGPNYTVNASKVTMLADYIKYLEGTGRVQFTTLDRSVTTTGNGAAASSSSTVGATDTPNAWLANAGVVFAVLAAILIVSLASVLSIRRRQNKNRRKR